MSVFRTQAEREKGHRFSTPSGSVSKEIPGGKNPGILTMAERHETMRTPEELIGKTLVAIVNLPPRPMMGLESCGMLLSAIHHENGEEKLNLLMVDPHIPAGAKLY